MTRSIVSGFFALLIAASQGPAWADPEARQWLQRMSMASQSLNYSGTFVYQRSGNLEAMRIVHAMDENGESERLLSLTGPKREVLRDNKVVTCILGDRNEVVVNKSRPRAPFPLSFPSELAELEQHYRFKVLDMDRVAGLLCRVVEVEPRDQYRYGRKLCVHDDSHLLLRSQLTGSDGNVIESIMFTTVDFPKKISRQELLPNLDGAGFKWHREPEQQPEPGNTEADSRWRIVQVPDGFMLTDHRWHQLSDKDPGVEHWVYSDGLASISVYIEKSTKDHDVYGGGTQRGALNAFGTMVGGYYVTVVGEVPRKTVEMIAKSVRIQ
jgi:sigma-E factor negative regulatory protein RseB